MLGIRTPQKLGNTTLQGSPHQRAACYNGQHTSGRSVQRHAAQDRMLAGPEMAQGVGSNRVVCAPKVAAVPEASVHTCCPMALDPGVGPECEHHFPSRPSPHRKQPRAFASGAGDQGGWPLGTQGVPWILPLGVLLPLTPPLPVLPGNVLAPPA